MGYLYDRWQSDSALVQGCTKRAEAYACTLQIVVPLADPAPCANGRWQKSNHFGKGWKSGDKVVLFPDQRRSRSCRRFKSSWSGTTFPDEHELLLGWCTRTCVMLSTK